MSLVCKILYFQEVEYCNTFKRIGLKRYKLCQYFHSQYLYFFFSLQTGLVMVQNRLLMLSGPLFLRELIATHKQSFCLSNCVTGISIILSKGLGRNIESIKCLCLINQTSVSVVLVSIFYYFIIRTSQPFVLSEYQVLLRTI